MELIKILLEQSTDYSNWNTTKPSDFSTTKYSVKTEVKDGKVVISYKLKETSGISLTDYAGDYKTNTTPSVTVKFIVNGDKLFIDYGLGVEQELTPSSSDEFTFKYGGQTNTVKFTKGSDNKVNAFDANIFGKTLKGTKEGSTANSNTPSPTPTATTPATTTTVVNKQYTKYDAITPEDRIKGFQWKDCESQDFPYQFGCKNTKIGEMNECLFDTKLSGIFYRDLLEKLKDMAFDMSKKEITKEMYDAVMLDCKQQEESIQKKKIIKENTYKILNQIK